MVYSLDKVLNTMASALSAESIRLNVTASNLANAGAVGSSPEETYRAKYPVFKEVQQNIGLLSHEQDLQGGVQVSDIIESKKPLDWRYDPNNPLADKEGKVYVTDVNPIEEMTNMIAASKEYQASVEVMNTAKSLMLQTIQLMKE